MSKRSALTYLCTPGLWAVGAHRAAHRMFHRGHGGRAMLLSTVARVLTGVDIHPATRIGERFTIEHGSGIVIGEQVVIGDDCVIMQGVTLGQLDPRKPLPPGQRQPILGNEVMVGANAVLIGPITVGDGAKIGAGAVVLCDVPAGATAVGNPARVIPGRREAPHLQAFP